MTVQLAEPQVRRWTIDEYYQLAEDGWFQGQRVRLINGEILQMPAHGHRHFSVLDRSADLLLDGFGAGYWVRRQAPIDIPPYSSPEPDIAVVLGERESYEAHPKTALLVVEVGDSSLHLDRRQANLYAAAGVPDYWILNLIDDVLELHRDPVPDSNVEFRCRYESRTVLRPHESVSPLSLPKWSVTVSQLIFGK